MNEKEVRKTLKLIDFSLRDILNLLQMIVSEGIKKGDENVFLDRIIKKLEDNKEHILFNLNFLSKNGFLNIEGTKFYLDKIDEEITAYNKFKEGFATFQEERTIDFENLVIASRQRFLSIVSSFERDFKEILEE